MKECKHEKKMPMCDDKDIIRCGVTGYAEMKGVTCGSDCPMYKPRLWVRMKRGWRRWFKDAVN